MKRAWVDLDREDLRQMLISLIGHRFGPRPEERLDDIRAEREAYAKGFLDLARVGPDDRVLDLGSGCGFGTRAMARRAASVVACDISPAFLTFARAECADLDNVRFEQIEPRDLGPVADNSVDAVVSMSVFIHLNLYDMYAYFRAFDRVLTSRGRVVFDFADADRLASRWRPHDNDTLFVEHADYYRDDPSSLAGLVQFNSARGNEGVARLAGFRRRRRRGHRLVFARGR